MTVEINLTHEGERRVDLLNSFADTNRTLMFYQAPHVLDVSGTRWTLGNDALLILSGDIDDKQTIAPTTDPEDVFRSFSDRVQLYFADIGLDFPIPPDREPEAVMRLIWNDFLELKLIKIEEVDDWDMITVPEL